jgi:hypothetical protein
MELIGLYDTNSIRFLAFSFLTIITNSPSTNPRDLVENISKNNLSIIGLFNMLTTYLPQTTELTSETVPSLTHYDTFVRPSLHHGDGTNHKLSEGDDPYSGYTTSNPAYNEISELSEGGEQSVFEATDTQTQGDKEQFDGFGTSQTF